MARPRFGGLKAARVPLRAKPFAYMTPGGNVMRQGRSAFHMQAVILNMPEVMAALHRVSLLISGPIAERVVNAAAEPIKERWVELAEGLNGTGRGEGHYGRAIQVRKALVKEDAAGGLAGASVYIYPGTVPGVPEDEQPRHYAGVLEFGGTLTAAQHYSVIPAQPTARPAFDQSKEKAVDAAGDAMAAALSTFIP